MKIKDLPSQNRPRERFLKQGASALSDSELLAIILRTGTKDANIIDVSNNLLNKYKLEHLFDCSLKELEEIKGIGQSKAMQILAISELSKRYNQIKSPNFKIKSAKDVFDVLKETLKEEKQENFICLLLNNQNNIIKQELVVKGILDAAIVDPRQIFKSAIKNSAAKIILVHNHPSGNPEPSEEDLDLTKKIIDAGDLLGIKVLDHVIVAKDAYWSWQENN